MAWYHQATSHYLNQLRPSSMTPYAITRPQCLQVTGTKESLLSNYIHRNCIWRLVSNKRLSAGISNPIPCNYTSIIHATYLFAGTSSQIMLYNHDNMFYELTHRWLHMAWWNLVNIGSGISLLSDDTKPLPDPILTYHQWGPLLYTSKGIFPLNIQDFINCVSKLLVQNYSHNSDATEYKYIGWAKYIHSKNDKPTSYNQPNDMTDNDNYPSIGLHVLCPCHLVIN